MSTSNTDPFAILENLDLRGNKNLPFQPAIPALEHSIEVAKLNSETTSAVAQQLTDSEPSDDSQKNQPPVIASPGPMDLLTRVLEAYAVAQVYATQINDDAMRASAEARLIHSNVHGSAVMNIRNFSDVEAMFKDAKNWTEIEANLKDPNISVIQAHLRPTTIAFAAYATVREFGRLFGAAGLSTIQFKIGSQQEDDYYAATVSRFPTNLLTVQLKHDPETGVEYLHQWFAGPEISSLTHRDSGDVLVRCGIQLQPVSMQRRPVYRTGKPLHAKHPR